MAEKIDLNIWLILVCCCAAGGSNTINKRFLTQWEGFYKHAESFVRQMTSGAVLHFFELNTTKTSKDASKVIFVNPYTLKLDRSLSHKEALKFQL